VSGRITLSVVGWLALSLSASAAELPSAPEEPLVQATVIQKTYPLKPPGSEKVHPGEAKTYTADAIVLENEYIQATIVPALEARLPRVVFKKIGRDLFWASDVVGDGSMGGTFFPFPLRETGHVADASITWRTVQGPDGSVTVAMDRRFTPLAGSAPGDGAGFSTLRMATYVTLRPGSAVLEYVARLDNRLPMRHGFRLWNMARFPREAGATVLLPVGSVTDARLEQVKPWPVWDGVDHRRLGAGAVSVFGAEAQGDWTGVYYPAADANHLILKPRYTAPGARLHVMKAKSSIKDEPTRADRMIEIWNGSNPTFDHPGHYLQAFGAYVLPLRLTMVTGIGRIDWANDSVAMTYTAQANGATVRVVAFRSRPGCRVMVRARRETAQATGTLRPDRPLVVWLTKRAEPVLVTVVDAEDDELAEASLPHRPKPTPPEDLKVLEAERKPWNWMAMELVDWSRRGAPCLPDAAKALCANLATHDTESVLAAARVIMRTERPGSARWQSVRNRLDFLVGRKPDHAYAQAYLGMMLSLEARGRPTPAAARHFSKAERLPAGRYLAALAALAAGKMTQAMSQLSKCASETPPVAMGLGRLAIAGNERLHPAALPGGQWPTRTQPDATGYRGTGTPARPRPCSGRSRGPVGRRLCEGRPAGRGQGPPRRRRPPSGGRPDGQTRLRRPAARSPPGRVDRHSSPVTAGCGRYGDLPRIGPGSPICRCTRIIVQIRCRPVSITSRDEVMCLLGVPKGTRRAGRTLGWPTTCAHPSPGCEPISSSPATCRLSRTWPSGFRRSGRPSASRCWR